MTNFIHLKSNDDLIYISINFLGCGRLYHDANAMAAQIYYNECLKDSFYIELERRAIELSASANLIDFGFDLLCLKSELNACLDALRTVLASHQIKDFSLISNKLKNYFLLHIQDNDNLAKMRLFENYFSKDFLNDKFGDFSKLSKNSLENYLKMLSEQANQIVVSANLSPAELSQIKSFLKGSPKLKLSLNSASNFIKSEQKNCSQAYVRFISSVDIKNLKERAVLSLAANVLGGGFGSRITEEIRVKRGLAYSAFAYLNSIKQNYFFQGFLQTKNSSKDEAIKIVKEQFSKLVSDGISEAEFKKAQLFLTGSEILKYANTRSRHLIACTECFNNLASGELREITRLIGELNLDECNEVLKSKKSLSELSFYLIHGDK